MTKNNDTEMKVFFMLWSEWRDKKVARLVVNDTHNSSATQSFKQPRKKVDKFQVPVLSPPPLSFRTG